MDQQKQQIPLSSTTCDSQDNLSLKCSNLESGVQPVKIEPSILIHETTKNIENDGFTPDFLKNNVDNIQNCYNSINQTILSSNDREHLKIALEVVSKQESQETIEKGLDSDKNQRIIISQVYESKNQCFEEKKISDDLSINEQTRENSFNQQIVIKNSIQNNLENSKDACSTSITKQTLEEEDKNLIEECQLIDSIEKPLEQNYFFISNLSDSEKDEWRLTFGKETSLHIFRSFDNYLNTYNQFLDISNTSFGDEGIKIISKYIAQMKNLKSINLQLYRCKITSSGAKLIADAFKQLVNLKHICLFLMSNKIQRSGANELGQAFASLTGVESLRLFLQNNKLNHQGVHYLSNSICKMKTLIKINLDLSENNIRDEGLKSISQAILKLTNLTELNLSLNKNEITNQSAMFLADSISTLSKLKCIKLDFASNKLTDSGSDYIGKSISYLKELNEVNVSFFENSLANLEEFIAQIASLELLRKLSLDFSVSMGSSFGKQFEKLVNLTSLTLIKDWSGFDNAAICQLGEQICKFINLKYLKVSLESNSFSEGGVSTFIDNIAKVKSIRTLSLNISGIHLGNSGVHYLGKKITEMDYLTSLEIFLRSVSANQLGITSITHSLSSLKQLNSLSLDFSQNEMKEDGAIKIGKHISQLTNLRHLELYLFECCINYKESLALVQSISSLQRILCLNLSLEFNQISLLEMRKIKSILYSQKRLVSFEFVF